MGQKLYSGCRVPVISNVGISYVMRSAFEILPNSSALASKPRRSPAILIIIICRLVLLTVTAAIRFSWLVGPNLRTSEQIFDRPNIPAVEGS